MKISNEKEKRAHGSNSPKNGREKRGILHWKRRRKVRRREWRKKYDEEKTRKKEKGRLRKDLGTKDKS